jgi:hypothetical protein
MPKAGGELTSMTDAPGRIATDGANFYWLNGPDLYRARVDGGSWSALASLPQRRSWNIVPRGRRLYAIDDSGVMVLRIDADVRAPKAVLEEPSPHPFAGLAVAGASLYYASTRYDEATQRDVPELRSIPKTGGAPRVVSSNQVFDSTPAMDDQFAYYRAADGAVFRAPLGGGTPVAIAPAESLSSREADHRRRLCAAARRDPPADVHVDATDVYWVDSARGGVAKASKRGGEPKVIARSADPICGLALDETHLYFTRSIWSGESTYGVVMKIAKSGGDAQVVASMGGQPARLVVMRSYVAFSQRMPDRLGYAAKNGGPTTYLDSDDPVAGLRDYVASLAAAGDVLYFTQRSGPHDGDIVRLSLPDGHTTVLASAQDHPTSLQVDDRSVFWINSGFTDGKMHRRLGCCAILTSPR